MPTVAELKAQKESIDRQIREAIDAEKAERQAHLDAITDALADATEGLAESVAFFGGRVPVLLTVDPNDPTKVNVEGRYASPQTGNVLASGSRHGSVKVDGKEYPSLNAAASVLFPEAGKKGTEAWMAYFAKRGKKVDFVE